MCVQINIIDSILIFVGPWEGEGTISKMCVQFDILDSILTVGLQHLSWAQLSGPSCSFFRGGHLGPGPSCPGPNWLGPDCPVHNLPKADPDINLHVQDVQRKSWNLRILYALTKRYPTFKDFTRIFYPAVLAISSAFLAATIIVYLKRCVRSFLLLLIMRPGLKCTATPLERSPYPSWSTTWQRTSASSSATSSTTSTLPLSTPSSASSLATLSCTPSQHSRSGSTQWPSASSSSLVAWGIWAVSWGCLFVWFMLKASLQSFVSWLLSWIKIHSAPYPGVIANKPKTMRIRICKHF